MRMGCGRYLGMGGGSVKACRQVRLPIIVITDKETAVPSSVNLGEKLEAFISQAVSNGRYGSRSEVLREGVRMIQEREQRLEQLDQALAQGLADIEAGRIEDAGLVFERLIARLDERSAKPRA
jgi:antitoxin ParD1/3/4